MKPGNKNSYNSLSDLEVNGKNYKFYSLTKAETNGLEGGPPTFLLKAIAFFMNGFKGTVAGIRSHWQRRCQRWPDFCRGSDGHNRGWMGTGSVGRFLPIGQGAYLTTTYFY